MDIKSSLLGQNSTKISKQRGTPDPSQDFEIDF